MNKRSYDKKLMNFTKKHMIINELGGVCEICGDNNIFHLECHHDNDKEHKISDLIKCRWSNIKKEIKKCRLLCSNCHMEYHYNQNNNVSDKRRKSKSIYLEYKNTNCVKCGYKKCDASLTFHHINPNEKLFSIGSLGHNVISIIDIKKHVMKELDKCIVLCRNCHNEEHGDKDFYNTYENKIKEKVLTYKEKSKKINREEVFIMKSKGFTNKQITEKLNCSKSTISDILRGRTKKDRELKKLYNI